jgi:hypothetical protein
LRALAGGVGDEIADTYQRILVASGALATGQNPDAVFPLISATNGLYAPGSAEALTGFRVDDMKLAALNGYLDSLPGVAPPADIEQASFDRGRNLFRKTSQGGARCTTCHQVDPNRFVPTDVIPMRTLYPAYMPAVIADRPAPLTPIADSAGPNPFFDNRVIVLDASVRADALRPTRDNAKGYALPMLSDMSRKRFLLNDSSVSGPSFKDAAILLLNPSRGPTAAHPFYLDNAQDRTDVAEFLRGLTTN